MLNVLFIILGLVLFVFARQSRTAKNKSGLHLNQLQNRSEVDCESQETIVVATYNIQGGKSLSGQRDITKSANVIKDADLVGVQEVYADTYLNKFKLTKSQTHCLACVGGFNWLFGATKRRWFREFRGNSLLSKLPVSEWNVEMLPHKSGKKFHNMLTARITWKGKEFHFINTHLNTRDGRDEQFEAVMNEFNKYARVILVGDLNSSPDLPFVRNALADDSITDAIGLMGADSDESNRIDWILTKGFHVHDAKIVEKGVSDHPYYQVVLSIV